MSCRVEALCLLYIIPLRFFAVQPDIAGLVAHQPHVSARAASSTPSSPSQLCLLQEQGRVHDAEHAA